jgi:hypothetical protein
MTLDWEIMELAQPLHSRSLQSSLTIIFPAPGSCISLKKTTCCVRIPAPDAKLDKVPELSGDSLMSD